MEKFRQWTMTETMNMTKLQTAEAPETEEGFGGGRLPAGISSGVGMKRGFSV